MTVLLTTFINKRESDWNGLVVILILPCRKGHLPNTLMQRAPPMLCTCGLKLRNFFFANQSTVERNQLLTSNNGTLKLLLLISAAQRFPPQSDLRSTYHPKHLLTFISKTHIVTFAFTFFSLTLQPLRLRCSQKQTVRLLLFSLLRHCSPTLGAADILRLWGELTWSHRHTTVHGQYWTDCVRVYGGWESTAAAAVDGICVRQCRPKWTMTDTLTFSVLAANRCCV